MRQLPLWDFITVFSPGFITVGFITYYRLILQFIFWFLHGSRIIFLFDHRHKLDQALIALRFLIKTNIKIIVFSSEIFIIPVLLLYIFFNRLPYFFRQLHI